jgi:flagellar biosynthesis component FlhA
MPPTATATITLDGRHPTAVVEPSEVIAALIASGEIEDAEPQAFQHLDHVVLTFTFRSHPGLADDLVAQKIAADAIAKVYRGLVTVHVDIRL